MSRAISLILDQYALPAGIIVWDNQSSDNTALIVSNFPEVDYFLASQHTFFGGARRLARQLVDTSWFCYLDADDYWCPSSLLNRLLFSPRIGLVCSSVEERSSDELLQSQNLVT